VRPSTGSNLPCPNCRICGPRPCASRPVPPFPVDGPHRALGCALLSRPPARSPVGKYTHPSIPLCFSHFRLTCRNATRIPLDDLQLSRHQAIPDARLQDAVQPSLIHARRTPSSQPLRQADASPTQPTLMLTRVSLHQPTSAPAITHLTSHPERSQAPRHTSHPLFLARQRCSSPVRAPAVGDQPSRMRSLSELFVLGAGHPGCPSPATGRSSLPTEVVCWGRKPVCQRAWRRTVTRAYMRLRSGGALPGRWVGIPTARHTTAPGDIGRPRAPHRASRVPRQGSPSRSRPPPRVGIAKRRDVARKTTPYTPHNPYPTSVVRSSARGALSRRAREMDS
jgi:hypothetical protein